MGLFTNIIYGIKFSNKKKTLIRVTAGDSLFKYKVPEGTECIGEGAFKDCASLQSLILPNSVTFIGKSAFLGCCSLQTITLPNSITFIEDNVFEGCKSLQQITIPESVKSIGEEAFLCCNSLKQINIPDSVRKIGDMAFALTSLQQINIPDSVKSIRKYAFWGCKGLQRIVVDKKNPEYDSRNDCNAIVETSNNKLVTGCVNTIIPDSVISIEDRAFYGCLSLQKIAIPDSVTSIGTEAFCGCESLQQITIPNSVTSIGRNAFMRCASLQHIIVPDSVTSIGDKAFLYCHSLQSIYVSPEKLSFFKNLLPDYVKLIKAKPTSNTSVKSNQTGKASSPYYLFFDTETTGLPLDYNAPTSNSANWPRLVQLSWIVTDVDGNIIKQSDNIIYPDGFIIPTESSNIHGITTAIAKEKGIPLATAINEFLADMNTVNILVGHNISFDLRIMGAELIRMGKRDIMQQKPSICTMQSSTNYCKIPSKNGFGYKWPRLQELHVKLFGCEFEDAHNSMSDITATLKCFKELKRRGIINK